VTLLLYAYAFYDLYAYSFYDAEKRRAPAW
jgi:hypothetical protein